MQTHLPLAHCPKLLLLLALLLLLLLLVAKNRENGDPSSNDDDGDGGLIIKPSVKNGAVIAGTDSAPPTTDNEVRPSHYLIFSQVAEEAFSPLQEGPTGKAMLAILGVAEGQQA